MEPLKKDDFNPKQKEERESTKREEIRRAKILNDLKELGVEISSDEILREDFRRLDDGAD